VSSIRILVEPVVVLPREAATDAVGDGVPIRTRAGSVADPTDGALDLGAIPSTEDPQTGRAE
jgi:hypothetical protein